MRKLFLALCIASATVCAPAASATLPTAVQRNVGKQLHPATRSVIVEAKDGGLRLEELKKGLTSGDKVILEVATSDICEVVEAFSISRPLQLRYFLRVRFVRNGKKIVALCEISRDGGCILSTAAKSVEPAVPTGYGAR